MISGRYTVHSSERIKSPARNAKIDAIYYVFDKSLRKTLSARVSFRDSVFQIMGEKKTAYGGYSSRGCKLQRSHECLIRGYISKSLCSRDIACKGKDNIAI